MTKLLEHGVKAVEALPPDRQDIAGKLLLEFARRANAECGLTPDQLEDVRTALAEMDRGELATDEEIEEVWLQFEQ